MAERRGENLREANEPGPPAPRRAKGLLLASVGGTKHRRNLRKDLADAGGNARHNRAGRNGHETRHQSVLDEVLTAPILPNLELQKHILHSFNLLSLECTTVPVANSKVSSAEF